jgi:hypothetical protein
MFALILATALSIAGLNLSTQNLKGEPRMFPADLAEKRAVVVLTFSKSASDEATQWTRKLRENEKALAASIYQIAILENVPSLFRSLVISGLRRAIPKDLHDHFWIATSASKEWQERIGSKFVNEAHVFVLESRSQITWRFHGAFSESGLTSLFEACSVLRNQ